MTAVAQRAATKATPTAPAARVPLRRACACGTHTPMGGECDSCKKKKVQAKFAVGAANDAFEREADAVADRVMRDAAPGPASPAPVAVQRAADRATDGSDAPASVDAVLARGGAPLDAGLRTDMEARFGHDFSHVRTHTDAAAERSAHEIDAAAYTAGHHVVFGRDRYAPSTRAGRRLIAHELTHVLQQTPGVVRRAPAPKAPKPKSPSPKAPSPKAPAPAAPELDVQMTAKPKPCACLVFIHHDEANARTVAKSLHEMCNYNLAIVKPQGKSRLIDFPINKSVDPNGLFPPEVAEACWNGGPSCDALKKANAAKTGAAREESEAQVAFFGGIDRCSKSFELPVVALHNNALGDTASYRKAIGRSKDPVDLAPIRGKTFDDTLKTGDKMPDANTLPFDSLKKWLLDELGDVEEGKATSKKAAPKKHNLKGGPFKPDNTNIFIWCGAKDNSKCHIGDPEHPDNVVWVTHPDDFAALRKTKTNVALQTRVDPTGNSKSDLSSLFLFLTDIVAKHYAGENAKVDLTIVQKEAIIKHLVDRFPPFVPREYIARELLRQFTQPENARKAALAAEQAAKDKKRRYINIETPPKGTSETARVEGLAAVKATLSALGLFCCDAAEVPKLDEAVRTNVLPSAAAAKGKTTP